MGVGLMEGGVVVDATEGAAEGGAGGRLALDAAEAEGVAAGEGGGSEQVLHANHAEKLLLLQALPHPPHRNLLIRSVDAGQSFLLKPPPDDRTHPHPRKGLELESLSGTGFGVAGGGGVILDVSGPELPHTYLSLGYK
jgi:hypothetical protein